MHQEGMKDGFVTYNLHRVSPSLRSNSYSYLYIHIESSPFTTTFSFHAKHSKNPERSHLVLVTQ